MGYNGRIMETTKTVDARLVQDNKITAIICHNTVVWSFGGLSTSIVLIQNIESKNLNFIEHFGQPHASDLQRFVIKKSPEVYSLAVFYHCG